MYLHVHAILQPLTYTLRDPTQPCLGLTILRISFPASPSAMRCSCCTANASLSASFVVGYKLTVEEYFWSTAHMHTQTSTITHTFTTRMHTCKHVNTHKHTHTHTHTHTHNLSLFPSFAQILSHAQTYRQCHKQAARSTQRHIRERKA